MLVRFFHDLKANKLLHVTESTTAEKLATIPCPKADRKSGHWATLTEEDYKDYVKKNKLSGKDIGKDAEKEFNAGSKEGKK